MVESKPTIPKRFTSAFYRGLWKTLADDLFSIIVTVAGAVYWLLHTAQLGGWSLHSLRQNGWEGLTIAVFVTAAHISWHGFRAAASVWQEIREESHRSLPQSYLPIFSGSGERIPAKQVRQSYSCPRLKLWGMACALLAISGIASYLMWAKNSPVPQPDIKDVLCNITGCDSFCVMNFFALPQPGAFLVSVTPVGKYPLHGVHASVVVNAVAMDNINIGDIGPGTGRIIGHMFNAVSTSNSYEFTVGMYTANNKWNETISLNRSTGTWTSSIIVWSFENDSEGSNTLYKEAYTDYPGWYPGFMPTFSEVQLGERIVGDAMRFQKAHWPNIKVDVVSSH